MRGGEPNTSVEVSITACCFSFLFFSRVDAPRGPDITSSTDTIVDQRQFVDSAKTRTWVLDYSSFHRLTGRCLYVPWLSLTCLDCMQKPREERLHLRQRTFTSAVPSGCGLCVPSAHRLHQLEHLLRAPAVAGRSCTRVPIAMRICNFPFHSWSKRRHVLLLLIWFGGLQIICFLNIWWQPLLASKSIHSRAPVYTRESISTIHHKYTLYILVKEVVYDNLSQTLGQ
jgi:hypothetical protein